MGTQMVERLAEDDDAAAPQTGVRRKDWKIKNVDPRAIQNARRLAKKQGMLLGTWVARAISAAADESSATSAALAAQGFNRGLDTEDLQGRLTSLEQRFVQDVRENAHRLSEIQRELRIITNGLLPELTKNA